MVKPSCSGTSDRCPSLGDELDSKLDADIFPVSHSGNVEPSGKDDRHDRLSNLPDDIVLNIVERLDIADATRTSILSRRLKQIPSMVSKIVMMVSSFEPWCDNWSILDDIARARANATMHEATKSILESRTASDSYSIQVMCLQFYLGEESTIPIGQTVAKAMATHKVGMVEFTLLTKVRARCTDADLRTQGAQFMSFVDACPNVFGGLTHLNLERMRLGESGFPHVFSICKQLKDLRLYGCDMGTLSLLELDHPQLSKVEIAACDFEKIDLKWLPKLTVLSHEYWISKDDPFSLGYVPLLQSVSISNIGLSSFKTHRLSQLLLSKASNSITDLHLNFKCERIWVKPEGRELLSMVFHRLWYLNLMNISEECDLNWTMFILQGAPTLMELCVTVQDHFCEMIRGVSRKSMGFSDERKDKAVADWESSLGFKLNSLAVLRIFGFQAQDNFVRYIRNVMEAALNLEKIYLHDKPVCRRCRRRVRRTSMYPRTWKHKSSIREEINKGTSRPVGIHFSRNR